MHNLNQEEVMKKINFKNVTILAALFFVNDCIIYWCAIATYRWIMG